jgi:hypothetical protein
VQKIIRNLNFIEQDCLKGKPNCLKEVNYFFGKIEMWLAG